MRMCLFENLSTLLDNHHRAVTKQEANNHYFQHFNQFVLLNYKV